MADEPLIDVTKVSDKGQVVVPKEIRDKMGFKVGTKLIVIAIDDSVVLQRIDTIAGKVKVRDIIERIKSVAGKLRLV